MENLHPYKKTGHAYKWQMLLLLWLAFFLNQADRQIFSILLPLIRADLGFSDAELGLISSSLVWVFGIMVPIAGYAGDKWSRRNIVGFSLIFWSIATVFTGASSTVLQFVLIRGIATGGGEAFYTPSANALISEEHKTRKSFALSIHQTAVYFGIILSGLIVGLVAEYYGWRITFTLFGSVGILVGVIILLKFRKDPPAQKSHKLGLRATAAIIGRKPTIVLLTAAFACMVFVNVGYLAWMPTLMVDKFGLSLAGAGFSSMFYHHIGAFAGVMMGGALSDRFSKINPKHRLTVQAVSLLAGAPFIYWMGVSHSLATVNLALLFFGLFRGAYDSNIFASLYEVVDPALKAVSSGLMLMCAFLTGAFSPFVLGMLKPALGLDNALSWLWIFYVLGAILVFFALILFFEKDRVIEPADDRAQPAGAKTINV